MFQGMARGKVGDVVFYRMDGEQMSRVRNRHPKNPRTAAQLYQRAIMATVMQAYSAGREIFDHSFQGREVGMGNQREFMSENIRILRGIIADDINNQESVNAMSGRVVAPRATSAVPFKGMLVSKGDVIPTIFKLDGAAGSSDATLSTQVITNDYNSSWTDVYAKYGWNVGDIYTVIGFVNTNEVLFTVPGQQQNYGIQYRSEFNWVRFILKEIPAGTVPQNVNIGTLFDIEVGGNLVNTADNIAKLDMGGDPITILDNIFGSAGQTGSVALIRSHVNRDLRSTSYTVELGKTNYYGIATPYLLEAWQKEIDELGSSELILEGGSGNFQ